MAHPYFELRDVDRRFWAERIAPWLPQRVFDAHRHINLAEHLGPQPPRSGPPKFPDEIAGPEAIELARQAYAELLPGHEVEFLAFGSPQPAGHLAENNAYLSRGLAGSGSVALALTPPTWDQELLLHQLRLPGIIGAKPYERLHPDWSGGEVSIFDFVPHQHLEVLNELGAWLTLHLPRAERLADPANISEVLQLRQRYPQVVLVIAHLGRSYSGYYARAGFPALAEDPGILFDTSAVLNPAVLALALDRFGPQRLLFGTDLPIFYMRGRRIWRGKEYINLTSGDYSRNTNRQPPEVEATYTLSLYEMIAALGDTIQALGYLEDALQAVFHDNARRLVAQVLARKERW